jgi:hypothetical protein
MMVWLASYPRSGNTFFRILLKQCFGITTYSIYPDHALAEQQNIRHFLRETVGHVGLFTPDASPAQDESAVVVKTHELPLGEKPAIYVVRDGRDSLVSYAHFIQTFEKRSDLQDTGKGVRHILRDLITYRGSFGGWGDHVLAWHKRTAPTAVVKFEDLVQSSEPWDVVQSALGEIGYPSPDLVANRSVPTFQELRGQLPSFFREGRVGSWRDEMTESLHEVFWEHYGEAMNVLGYEK